MRERRSRGRLRHKGGRIVERWFRWARYRFTHGYGPVMNFVSKKTSGGLPDYIIDNIPPESAFNMPVNQPAIYYGEKTPGYRIVATKIKEFDYPQGNQNVYTSYQGKGGIPLDRL